MPSLPNDVLSDNVAIWRPTCRIFLSRYLKGVVRFCEVVYQSIKPNVYCLRFVVGDWDSPAQPFQRTWYRQILKTNLHLIYDILHPVWRQYPLGISRIKVKQAILECRQPKVVVVLRSPFHFLSCFYRCLKRTEPNSMLFHCSIPTMNFCPVDGLRAWCTADSG